MQIINDGRTNNVIITDHLNDIRTHENKSRAYNYSEEDILEILDISFKQGLSSFRNKGTVKIKYKDEEGYLCFMILKIDDNDIRVITIMDSRHKNDDFYAFIKVQNIIDITRFYIHEERYELKIINVSAPTRQKIKKVNKKIHKNKPKIQDVTQDEIDEFLSALR